MNHKSLLALILLCFVSSAYAERLNVTPTIINRSQGRSADLKVAGLAEKVHLYGEDKYINLDATIEYARSFRSNRMAECLFGAALVNNCNAILIQGSDVADRNSHAWLADYFYLAPDFNADFSIDPRIQSVIVNLDLFVGLDQVLEGLYFRAHGPIAWSQWNLNFIDCCDVETTHSFRPGYFAHDTVSNDQLLQLFHQYARGEAPAATSGTSTQPEIGVSFQGLKFAKMERCSRSRTGFAELRMELGYNFLQAEDYHLGLNVQVAAPTGSRRDAEFVFDPTIGNGNHWEVGAGITAHYLFWQAEAEDQHAGFYLDASITHINNGKEQRTFDLTGRPNSRYMLAMKMGRPVNFLRAGATTGATVTSPPIAQFKGEYAPVANLTTIDVHVRSSIQADVAAMFNYTTSNWAFDLGYNFWGRSCERINVPDRPTSNCCPNLCTMEKDTWALKGDAAVFGFMSSGQGSLGTSDPVALSGTQCGATMQKGTNADADVADCTGIDRLQNCGVDNAQFAFGRDAATGTGNLLVHTPGLTNAQDAIKTSLEPKFINCCDINFQRTRGISHKLFINGNYTWELEGWSPYVGIGGSVEFASRTSDDNCPEIVPDCTTSCENSCCPSACTDCLICSISQWALWLKGGVTFN